uniref:Uncharacterized protein n=1 Tax=Coptotermes formosanus TaxID=36987 RepID=R4UP55_COPFO|nr:hypothetical protein [Coptotermes formosanus]
MSEWLNGVIQETQQEVVKELERLVEEKGIKEKVMAEVQDLAKKAAAHLLDQSQPELATFPSIPLEGEKEYQYLLVLEFLQSAGFKFAPNVLRFESQNPDVVLDRRDLGKKLRLCTYDRTPYLVQLIEEQIRQTQEEED